MKKDEIFSKQLKKIEDFKFDSNVVSVFDDMIERSVPGYSSSNKIMFLFINNFIQKKTNIYDLGCSTGIVTELLLKPAAAKGCRITGIDNSESMIEECRKRFSKIDSSLIKPEFCCSSIEDITIENASIVIINYTLQFIERPKRAAVINKIYKGLNPGGILLFSEKLTEEKQNENLLEELHYLFKQSKGYSELEISQKRQSLTNVLIPESEQDHLNRLSDAGFKRSALWHRSLNFASFIAQK